MEMSSIAKPIIKVCDTCILSLPCPASTLKPVQQVLSISSKHIKLQLSSSPFLQPKSRFSNVSIFVAKTSDWAQQEEEEVDAAVALTESEQELDGPNWGNEAASELQNWEGEGGDEGFFEPPEEAKLFVGNLPYDVDSQRLAMIFEKAGTVEIAEVIYNRDTDTSRGFGFVTMSTIEEADKAVDLLHRYDIDGRLLTVTKAAPRGSRPERPPRGDDAAYKIYVGNIPWDIDNPRLEQIFSEHGKVVEARVVYDRDTGRSRGFGFVTMSSKTEMDDAIAALDGQSLDGRAIRVNVAEERPRRNF